MRYDPATDEVRAEVAAFSQARARGGAGSGAPVTSLMQRVITSRYLTAL